MNYKKLLIIIMALNICAIVIAGLITRKHIQRVRAAYEDELHNIHQKYDFKLNQIAFNLGYHQAKIGRGTYLTTGKPNGHDPVNGYPRCNLGCIIISYDGIPIQRNFLDAYNKALIDYRNNNENGSIDLIEEERAGSESIDSAVNENNEERQQD